MNILKSMARDLTINEHILRIDEGTLSNQAPSKISKVLAALINDDPTLFVLYSEHTWYDGSLSKKTAGVRPAGDGKHIIFIYNAEWLDSLSYEQMYFLLLHEAGHIMRDHSKRAEEMGVNNRSHEIANICMDVWINQDIAKEGGHIMTPKVPFDVFAYDKPAEGYGDINEWVKDMVEKATGQPFTDKFTGTHTTEALFEWVWGHLNSLTDDREPAPPKSPSIGDIIVGPDGRFGKITSMDENTRKVTGISIMTKDEAFREARERAGLANKISVTMLKGGREDEQA